MIVIEHDAADDTAENELSHLICGDGPQPSETARKLAMIAIKVLAIVACAGVLREALSGEFGAELLLAILSVIT